MAGMLDAQLPADPLETNLRPARMQIDGLSHVGELALLRWLTGRNGKVK